MFKQSLNYILFHYLDAPSSLYTVLQPPVSDPVQLGGDTTLQCSILTDNSVTAWFKQTPGEKPLLIASAYRLSATVYHNGFDKSGRFTAVTEKDIFTLNISNTEASDSATYFCAVAYYTDIALLDYAPSSLYTVLQPPVSDPVQLGGDTTLQCSILTDNSAGDHSVYWFRHGSGESDPGIIFTHGNRSDQCKKSSETVSPTQSCIYKLPKNNLSLSDAGTYYCAVAACGHIFFGNGTKLDLTGVQCVMVSVFVLASDSTCCSFPNTNCTSKVASTQQ
uniref:Ig-like domain-containing protein n=1 Tax=Astyanax mexicanus TaxID=7994 RepID=A0A3B1KH07_ASTMX